MLCIGIDPGTETGLAVWDTVDRKLLKVESTTILEAQRRVKAWNPSLVVFEDARLRKVFTATDKNEEKYGAGVREGVGSVKRDCSIWQEFLEHEQLPYLARMPMYTKKSADMLAHLTGWVTRTNKHSRDAALIVAGLNTPMAEGMVRAWQQRSTTKTAPSSRKVVRSAGTRGRRFQIAGVG